MTDFIFDGEKLSEYGYMMCSFDSETIETIPISTSSFNEIKSPLSDTSHKTSVSYSENLSKKIQIMKMNCNDNNYEITDEEISSMTKWLCRKEYKWFQWIKNGITCQIYYEVYFRVSKIEIAEVCVGLELSIISNRPYALSPIIELNKTITSTDNLLTINLDNDDEGYIYPDVEITINQDGNVVITNQFENRRTVINNCVTGEIINIIGDDTLQITSSIEGHDLSNDFNYNFLCLCNKYNENENILKIDLDCDIRVSYREKRKVGL